VSELEFNVPFQHKHGYIRDELYRGGIWIGEIQFCLEVAFFG